MGSGGEYAEVTLGWPSTSASKSSDARDPLVPPGSTCGRQPALDAAGPDAVAVSSRTHALTSARCVPPTSTARWPNWRPPGRCRSMPGIRRWCSASWPSDSVLREVFCTADTTPFARKRDATVEDALAQRG